MAEIFNIADRFKKPVEKPTVEQLAQGCVDELIANWQKFAKINRLNDFFVQSVPTWTNQETDYLSDLTALSVIESKIDLTLMLHAPQSMNKGQMGWSAAFRCGALHIACPLMPFETHARCFNILMFLKLSREMTNHGITPS